MNLPAFLSQINQGVAQLKAQADDQRRIDTARQKQKLDLIDRTLYNANIDPYSLSGSDKMEAYAGVLKKEQEGAFLTQVLQLEQEKRSIESFERARREEARSIIREKERKKRQAESDRQKEISDFRAKVGMLGKVGFPLSPEDMTKAASLYDVTGDQMGMIYSGMKTGDGTPTVNDIYDALRNPEDDLSYGNLKSQLAHSRVLPEEEVDRADSPWYEPGTRENRMLESAIQDRIGTRFAQSTTSQRRTIARELISAMRSEAPEETGFLDWIFGVGKGAVDTATGLMGIEPDAASESYGGIPIRTQQGRQAGGIEGDSAYFAQKITDLSDLPPRSAAYIASSIMQESSGKVNAEYHQDPSQSGQGGIAGGLVSFRDPIIDGKRTPKRLTKAERWLGVDHLKNASVDRQIEYILYELERDFPRAWETLMDPRSKDVDLRKAMYDYLRWASDPDELGQRGISDDEGTYRWPESDPNLASWMGD